MGEFLYFLIYVIQQLGIVFGVGAQTVLLCMHLVALHHGEKDNPHASYARAAHFALGLGLLFIYLSGAVAVGVHAAQGELAVLFSPAFLFKWLLIAVLTPAYFLYNHFAPANGHGYFAFTGGTWYALFLVHSVGPVTTWATLIVLYAFWMLFFTLVWAAFVRVMKWKLALPAPQPYPAIAPPAHNAVSSVLTVAVPIPPAPKPVPPPPPPPLPAKPAAVPLAHPVPPPPPVPPKPAAIPMAHPPVVAKKNSEITTSAPSAAVALPERKPATAQAPTEKKSSFWKKLLSWFAHTPAASPQPSVPKVVVASEAAEKPVFEPSVQPAPSPSPVAEAPLPVVKPLSLPGAIVVQPLPQKIQPTIVPPAPSAVPPPPPAKPSFVQEVQEVIDHMLVPALRIMPKTPEDIAKHNRPPVVKSE